MKQCRNCKRELKDELMFCPFDGEPLSDSSAGDEFLGLLLDDKYRLDEKVGEGGMGTVYRATHIKMENTVAVKILHPHLASDEYAVERFRREARSAAQIRHPNAVAVTDFGVTKGSEIAYLVMEFLEGEDLRQRIKQKRQLDLEEAFLILSETCSAVSAAHSRGIIHRDLKPDNIWLVKTEKGAEHVKVLDFGIAKLKSGTDAVNLTQKGTIVGTPYYMSPEHCRGEELDAGADVYSLGVILYEMLTGRVPFDGSTALAIVLKHNTEHPRPLRERRPEISEQVQKVVLRALEKKRQDRQESAMQLAQELQAALYASGMDLRGHSRPSTLAFGWQLLEWTSSRVSRRVGGRTRALDSAARASRKGVLSGDSTLAIGDPNSLQGAARGVARPLGEIEQGGTQAYSARSERASRPVTTDGVTTRRINLKSYLIAAALVVVLAGVVGLIVMRSGGRTSLAPGGPAVQVPPPPGMLRVPGGTFKMGTDDATAKAEWRPSHNEAVAEFFLDVNEVTNEEYERFVKETGHPAPPHWKDGVYEPGDTKLPITYVSWDDARAYADWAKKRLPSEAEWEYAARGAEDRVYPWGDDWSPAFSNSKEDGRNRVVAVGSYPNGRSWCGINDMAGNVAEWVADDYKPYQNSPAQPQTKKLKVIRGGAYKLSKDELITYVRWADEPNKRYDWLGFRCAKDVPR